MHTSCKKNYSQQLVMVTVKGGEGGEDVKDGEDGEGGKDGEDGTLVVALLMRKEELQ